MQRSFSFIKTTALAALMLPLVLFQSCTEEQPEYHGAVSEGFLDLDFIIGETKAAISPDGTGSFTEGDKIGLYVQGDNGLSYQELTFSGTEWTPMLRRSDFGDGKLVLSAHYPSCGEDADPTSHVLEITPDQRGNAMQEQDILVSQAELESGEYKTEMRFSHALHRLDISLDGLQDEPEVYVRSMTSGSINLLTGEAVAEGDDFQWITPYEAASGSYLAIIIPQSAEPYRDGDGLVKVSAGGKDYTYMAPATTQEGAGLEYFETGKKTTVNLTFKEGNPDLAGKCLWVKGLDVPDFPGDDKIPTRQPYEVYGLPSGEWFRYSYTFEEMQYLTWKEGCGWYDCNKSNGYTEDDGNMCWAASASNLLIWWMNMNKNYIQAYDADYGSSVSTESGTIRRPSYDFLPLYPNGTDGVVNRAEVFEFFKAHFPNMGNNEDYGVNWFITGAFLGSDINGFKGFFNEVFTRSDKLTASTRNKPDGDMFNTFVTDALLSGKALGFDVYDIAGKGTGNHAMTVWGVEYDESGRIAYIYYCDNNMADQDPNGAAMVRKQIVYEKDENTGLECTYLKKLEPKEPLYETGKFLITNVISVDLGRDLWKKKYPLVKDNEND